MKQIVDKYVDDLFKRLKKSTYEEIEAVRDDNLKLLKNVLSKEMSASKADLFADFLFTDSDPNITQQEKETRSVSKDFLLLSY